MLEHGAALGYVPLHDGVPIPNVSRAKSEILTLSPVGPAVQQSLGRHIARTPPEVAYVSTSSVTVKR